jgi:hypothetical protein
MHVVVDGSNLATEGRSLPSLQQLIEGVIDFRTENPDAEVVVVVDATFGHRIDSSELPQFEDAIVHQEIVSPPAGAIGRGDAFVLRIAEKVGAVVLSNDSFQEFHAEHEWLFDKGRLIGGKPVPGVGWIFTPRTPVRGPKSREVTQEAKRKQRKTKVTAEAPLVTGAELLEKGKAALDKLPKGRREKAKKDEPKGRDGKKDGREPKKDEPALDEALTEGSSLDGATERRRGGGDGRRGRRGRGPVEDAIDVATVEAVMPSGTDEDGGGGGKRRKRRRKPTPPAEPVNEPGVFLQLVAAHRPGEIVEGQVETFSSHGAFITVDGARCYIPLTLMGEPAPRAARDVLKRGEVRPFVLRAFDAARRGVELALPGIDLPVGPVADETAAAAVGAEAPDDDLEAIDTVEAIEVVATPAKPRRARKAAASIEQPLPVPAAAEGPARPRRSRKAAAAAPEAAPLPAAEAASAPPKRPPRKKAAPAKAPVPAVEVSEAAPEAAPAKRSRKKVAPPVVEAGPEPAAAPRPRGSRKATPAADLPAATIAPEAPPAAKRATKRQAARVEEAAEAAPSTPPRKRAVKRSAAPVEEAVAEAAPVTPSRKRASKKAPAPAPAPAGVDAPPASDTAEKAAKRPRKKAAAATAPAAKAAPAKKAPAKRAAKKKTADPS